MKLSVIIPAYNAERSLGRCMESVACQLSDGIEVVIVDDGSTDGSGAICDYWARRIPNVRVLHKENGGVSSARNAALQIAGGEFIMMLDSDDTLAPHACGTLLELQGLSEADCIIFGTSDSEGHHCVPPGEILYGSFAGFREDGIRWIKSGLLCPPFNKLYRRSLVKNGFRQDMSFGEDYVFSLDYLKNCQRIQFIRDELYMVDSRSEGSLTRSFRKTRIHDIEKYQEVVSQFLPDEADNPELYVKYVADVLNYVRELYCCRDMGYREKRQILQQWYKGSYMRRYRLGHQGSMFYNMLCVCVRWQWWSVPQAVLWTCRKASSVFASLTGQVHAR